jgi:hypothetical protein
MSHHAPAAIFASPDDSEELARAELYGLLSRLWLAPPDDELLQQFRVAVTQAPEPGGHLEGPWQDLVAAMRATTAAKRRRRSSTPSSWRGQARGLAYGSYHLSGFLNEKPLASCAPTWPRSASARDERAWRPRTTWPMSSRSCAT